MACLDGSAEFPRTRLGGALVPKPLGPPCGRLLRCCCPPAGLVEIVLSINAAASTSTTSSPSSRLAAALPIANRWCAIAIRTFHRRLWLASCLGTVATKWLGWPCAAMAEQCRTRYWPGTGLPPVEWEFQPGRPPPPDPRGPRSTSQLSKPTLCPACRSLRPHEAVSGGRSAPLVPRAQQG